ncbi:copper homeostasis periplasmic binding protein CopC [Rhizobium sp. RAF36]|jgi:methionine-rich copper-binding protein CopC|uniref:copper homeostasis periplasmic binding protein CopC n=1 Tax=Rhizobium sp. RAF36 TaxID=3233055 RepID=UPI003F9C0E02
MTFRLAKLLLLTACVAAISAPAWAHAHLETSLPASGATVSSPPVLSVDMSEALEPSFSTITVTDSTGAPVAIGDSQVGGEGGRQLSATVPKTLKAGLYHVEWHVLSKDGHRNAGKFDFTVAP